MPYAWIAWKMQSVVALVVFLNGIWFHVTRTRLSMICDIACNAVFIPYLNWVTTWQPMLGFLTLCSVAGWVLATHLGTNAAGALVHVTMVQWPLGCGLVMALRYQ